MTRDFDIIIAGGGLNGLTLALAVAQGGATVALVDPGDIVVRGAQGFDGRGYALSLASVRLLAALGVWAGVAERSQPILDVRVSDGRAGEGAAPLDLHFDHAEIEEGPLGHMLEDRHLRPALLAQVDRQARITHLDCRQIAGHTVSDAGVAVLLADGSTLTAGLLVGADGKRSPTAMRCGIRRIGWGYGQTALVAAIDHDLPHNGCAHQFFTPQGPLAVLPLPGNRSSIVWTEQSDTATAIASLNDADYLDILRPRFGDFLGEIALAGKRFSYPLQLSLATRWVSDRVALAGDAAHVVHPIAGQGLNAGLKDVAALAQVVTDAARRGEDPGRADVLERYESWRRFDTLSLAAATDAVNRLFSNDNPLLRLARDAGMAAVNAMPALRRGLIREAAGLGGDTPRLSRGLPL